MAGIIKICSQIAVMLSENYEVIGAEFKEGSIKLIVKDLKDTFFFANFDDMGSYNGKNDPERIKELEINIESGVVTKGIGGVISIYSFKSLEEVIGRGKSKQEAINIMKSNFIKLLDKLL